MKGEHLLIAVMVAIGAVGIILYQHASATALIQSTLNAGVNATPGTVAVNYASGLGVSASLAGTPTVGQEGSSTTPAVVPLNVMPGYGFGQ
jgi:hypothetical protein